jgi:hypothetical protein
MKKANKTTMERYLAYLQDIYNGSKNCHSTTIKHKIGHNVATAVRLAGYVNDNGDSIMKNAPTLKDARRIRQYRNEYDNGQHRAKNKQLSLPLTTTGTLKKQRIYQCKKTREISILWGLIKIKH